MDIHAFIRLLKKWGPMAYKFVSQQELAGEFAALLSELGDADSKQAEKALSDAGQSGDPNRERTMAITLLRSSVGTFELAIRKEDDKFFSDKGKIRDLYRKLLASYAAIATIYSQLGERALMQSYAEQFRDKLTNCLVEYYVNEDNEIDEANEQDRAGIDFFRDLRLEPWDAHHWRYDNWHPYDQGETNMFNL